MKGMLLEEMKEFCEDCKKDTVHRFIYGLREKVCAECYVGSAELEAYYIPVKDYGMTKQDIITRKKNRPTAFYKKTK